MTKKSRTAITDWNTMYELGKEYSSKKEYKKAIEVFERLSQEAFLKGMSLTYLGDIYLKLKDLKKAEEYYEKSVIEDPEYALPYVNLGNFKMNKGENKKAKKFYKTAISLKEDFDDAWSALGLYYEKEGNLDEAMSCYLKAISFNKTHIIAHLNLGNVYVKKKELTKAEQEFKLTTEVDKNYELGWTNLSCSQMEQNKFYDAKKSITKALNINPRNIQALLIASNIAFEMNNLKESMKFALKVEKLDKNNPDAKKIIQLLSENIKQTITKEIIDKITNKALKFSGGKGMVLIIQLLDKIRIYFINRMSHVSWNFFEGEAHFDRLGENNLEKPILKYTLKENEISSFMTTLKERFNKFEIIVTSLWKLDRFAPDYFEMLQKTKYDLGMRISFS